MYVHASGCVYVFICLCVCACLWVYFCVCVLSPAMAPGEVDLWRAFSPPSIKKDQHLESLSLDRDLQQLNLIFVTSSANSFRGIVGLWVLHCYRTGQPVPDLYSLWNLSKSIWCHTCCGRTASLDTVQAMHKTWQRQCCYTVQYMQYVYSRHVPRRMSHFLFFSHGLFITIHVIG